MAPSIGLIGKHPGYGDFLQAGVTEGVANTLNGWIDHAFAGLRDTMGNDWPPFWDRGQDLRFWIGAGLAGRTVAGVMRASRDRVGRRYPLLLFVEGALIPPPVVAAEQKLWDQLAAHLDAMQPGEGARALLAGLALELAPEPPVQEAGPTIWAHRADGDLAALFHSATPVDAARAQLMRSHWWAPGRAGQAAIWLGCPGLPAPAALGWLLAGVAQAAPMADPAAPEVRHA